MGGSGATNRSQFVRPATPLPARQAAGQAFVNQSIGRRFNAFMKDRPDTGLGLFLSGHLLLDLAPRADLKAPADPAKTFVAEVGNFGPAYRASGRFLQAIGRNVPLGLLENLRLYDGFRFSRSFAPHICSDLTTLWQKPVARTTPTLFYTYRVKRPPESAR
jgi:hypothetical protein